MYVYVSMYNILYTQVSQLFSNNMFFFFFLDDWTILRFLRGCKFSLERTKEKLDMFYTCKTLCPEWYKNRDPQDKKLREILELGWVQNHLNLCMCVCKNLILLTFVNNICELSVCLFVCLTNILMHTHKS